MADPTPTLLDWLCEGRKDHCGDTECEFCNAAPERPHFRLEAALIEQNGEVPGMRLRIVGIP